MEKAANSIITPPASPEDVKMSSAPNASTLPPKSDGDVRHCGFCLNICPYPVKLCGKCRKRAYCSKECQTADWSVKGNGQRHKNWCGVHEYGEEDIDWEVVPVPNKGLGIRAKRPLPAGYRIIVEPIFTNPNGHPGIKDLEPEGASLEVKFARNYIEVDDQNFLCLRISRVNHNCRPNAGWSYNDVAQVAILYALQDIQNGEKICRTYVSEFDFNLYPAQRIRKMMDTPREECPVDCFCKDRDARELMQEGRRLTDEMRFFLRPVFRPGMRSDTEKALSSGEKRLEIERRLNMSWSDIAQLECELFQISLMQKETMPKDDRLIRDAIRIYKIIHPYSKLIEKYEKLMVDFQRQIMMEVKKEEAEKFLGKLTLSESPEDAPDSSESKLKKEDDSSATRHCAA